MSSANMPFVAYRKNMHLLKKHIQHYHLLNTTLYHVKEQHNHRLDRKRKCPGKTKDYDKEDTEEIRLSSRQAGKSHTDGIGTGEADGVGVGELSAFTLVVLA